MLLDSGSMTVAGRWSGQANVQCTRHWEFQKSITQWRIWRGRRRQWGRRESLGARIAGGPVELQCVRKSIRWCGRSLLAFQICGTSKECRATCLKPYCAIQIAGPLARAPAEVAARYKVHPGVVEGTRSLSWIKRTPGQASRCCDAGLRCWRSWWLVVVAAAEEAAAGSQISNLKSQPSQAIGRGSVLLLLLLLVLPPLWVCVSAARKGGLQTIQAENSNLGVGCCTCWSCLQLCWKQDELVTYYSGGIGQKSTNALPSGEKCCSGLGRCHTHTNKYTHTHRHRQDQIKEMKRKYRGVRKLKKHQAKKLAMQSGRSAGRVGATGARS